MSMQFLQKMKELSDKVDEIASRLAKLENKMADNGRLQSRPVLTLPKKAQNG